MKWKGLIAILVASVMGSLLYLRGGQGGNVETTASQRGVEEAPATRPKPIGPAAAPGATVPLEPMEAQIVIDAMEIPALTEEARVRRANRLRLRLADFFRINSISEPIAEQMVQALVDINYRLSERGNAMMAVHKEAKADAIARGEMVIIERTPEEEAELNALRSALYRDVFGDYYEAHEIYNDSYPQRERVGRFESGLSAPMEYAAKEHLVQIMHEEWAQFAIDQRGGEWPNDPNLSPDEQDIANHLSATQAYNERVLRRANSYLTREEFDHLVEHLKADIRLFERQLELLGLSN